MLAAGYAQLGKLEEARQAMRELLASGRGDMTIAAVIQPFLRNVDRESYAEALRLVGMLEA